jgi:threonine/homoserine/homoserine lactone efflux protein
MEASLFPRGLIIGFAIAAPVGPIGVLVIRRTLANGRLTGLVSGAGAATADAFYGVIAAFGLTAISGMLVQHSVWIRCIGGVIVCVLGLKSFRIEPTRHSSGPDTRGLGEAYLSTTALTLSNPTTIVSFSAVFAGLGLGSTQPGHVSAALLVLGVFFGSLLWWIALSGAISLFRRRFSPAGLLWVNRVSGVVLVAFGLAILLSAAGVL